MKAIIMLGNNMAKVWSTVRGKGIFCNAAGVFFMFSCRIKLVTVNTPNKLINGLEFPYKLQKTKLVLLTAVVIKAACCKLGKNFNLLAISKKNGAVDNNCMFGGFLNINIEAAARNPTCVIPIEADDISYVFNVV